MIKESNIYLILTNVVHLLIEENVKRFTQQYYLIHVQEILLYSKDSLYEFQLMLDTIERKQLSLFFAFMLITIIVRK